MSSSFERVLLAAVLLAACDHEPTPAIVVYVTDSHAEQTRAFVEPFDEALIGVRVVSDPVSALGTHLDAQEVALVTDHAVVDGYSLERHSDGVIVHGHAPLGVDYGLAHLLEASGFRFFHPERMHIPETVTWPAASDPVYGVAHEPEMSLRAIHLHTLHPIEAYFTFLDPGEEHLAGARRTIDWVIKNRGNMVQWWMLNEIKRDNFGDRDHVRAVVDYAHMRGIRVGASVQLFSGANLQQGFDLTTGGADSGAELEANLGVLDGFGFDALKISFGEFSGEEPSRFIEILNDATERAHIHWPDIEVSASIHVGNYPDLRLDFMGETDLLYYFLVRFADPRITPWIHTVMYYNLFDSASLAYLHPDFSEHRAYLYDRLATGDPVAYYPESAYWVAFDNSIPTYLPVYLRSRWMDQRRIRDDAAAMGISPLRQHAIFSSGWEWGYWQTDYLVLRDNFELSDGYADAIGEMLAPLGADGAATAEAIVTAADAQYAALIEGELGPYMAGRDATIDAGFLMGIVAAPDRMGFEALRDASPAERAEFSGQVIEPLEALADETEVALAMVPASEDPWISEVRDGLEVDVARGRFVATLYRAMIQAAAGEDFTASITLAEAELARGLVVSERRHADLHASTRDPDLGEAIVHQRLRTDTLYNYGYLREADTLCFWRRELVEVRNLLLGETETVPACVL